MIIEIFIDGVGEVSFEGYPERDNASFDHAFGTCRFPDHWTMDNSDITWDESQYSREDNKAIKEYLDKYFMKVSQEFEEKAPFEFQY